MAFLNSIGSEIDYLEPKYKPIYDSWKANPSPASTGSLLKTVQPAIDKGVFAHVGTNPSPILRSKARRMALTAIKSYDPKQSKLSTHIINQLQGLKRVNRQQTQILAIPERVSIDQGFIEKAKAELEDELGREPSLSELSDRTSLSHKRINYVHKFRYPKSEGSFDNMSEDDGGGFSPAIEQGQTNSWIDFVYADMDDTNKKIMEWTLGLYGSKPMSNQMIAKRLRMTPGAVSQRKAKIQTILEQNNLNPFI